MKLQRDLARAPIVAGLLPCALNNAHTTQHEGIDRQIAEENADVRPERRAEIAVGNPLRHVVPIKKKIHGIVLVGAGWGFGYFLQDLEFRLWSMIFNS